MDTERVSLEAAQGPIISCWQIHQMRPDEASFPACCISCHDEYEELGMDMCAVDDPVSEKIGNHLGGVCCSVSVYLKEKPLTKEEWERLDGWYKF